MKSMQIRNPITNEWEEVFLPPTGDTYPIGMYGWFAGEKAPTNWLRCDGQEISRTEYKELFNAIGTTYGVGDGSTTFNLPNVNLENRTLVGSSGDGEFSVGNTGGEKEHTLTIDEMPSHKHGVGYVGGNANGNHAGMPGTSAEPNSYNNELFINSKGGDQPHNNMQPYMASVCCIKAKQSVGIVGNVVNDMNSQGDSDVANAKTVKEYVDDNTNKASKIVWNNPNPTSDFSTQEITLDSSFANYNAYEIVYKGWKGNLQMASTGIVPKTTGAIMYYLESSTVLGLRQSNASVNNKMNIGNASGTGMNNAYIIPQMVIAHYIKEM